VADHEPPDWCAEHAELFSINGVSPEEVLDQVISGLTKTWQERNDIGHMVETNRDSVLRALRTVGKGKPFCCHIGDAKLQAILIRVSTTVEKHKARK
jgi:hypothetical protein